MHSELSGGFFNSRPMYNRRRPESTATWLSRLTVRVPWDYNHNMTIQLPEIEAVERFSPDELRLELACALYARGLIGKVAGADLAGIDFFSFQRGLGERGIPMCTDKMFEEDMANLESLFPR